MAVFEAGTLVNRITGKLGGHSFANNLSGGVLRGKGGPRGNASPKKGAWQNQWKYLTQSWLNLSPVDRITWDPFTANFQYKNKVGEFFPAVPHLVYAATNNFYFKVNSSILSPAPAWDPPLSGFITGFTFSQAGQLLQFNAHPPATFHYLQISFSAPFAFGQEALYKTRITQQSQFFPIIANPTFIDIGTLFWSQYPYAQLFDKVWLMFQWLNGNSYVPYTKVYSLVTVLP